MNYETLPRLSSKRERKIMHFRQIHKQSKIHIETLTHGQTWNFKNVGFVGSDREREPTREKERKWQVHSPNCAIHFTLLHFGYFSVFFFSILEAWGQHWTNSCVELNIVNSSCYSLSLFLSHSPIFPSCLARLFYFLFPCVWTVWTDFVELQACYSIEHTNIQESKIGMKNKTTKEKRKKRKREFGRKKIHEVCVWKVMFVIHDMHSFTF